VLWVSNPRSALAVARARRTASEIRPVPFSVPFSVRRSSKRSLSILASSFIQATTTLLSVRDPDAKPSGPPATPCGNGMSTFIKSCDTWNERKGYRMSAGMYLPSSFESLSVTGNPVSMSG